MASRLRPTPEAGRVAATKQPASSLGPSWAQRGSREARLAFRQAQKRGDREGAMRIAGEADKQGLASQASIGSAEERLAGQYQGRGADTAVTAEIETALTPPGPGRADGQPDKIMTPAGERNAPRGGVQEETARTMEMRPGPTSVASRFQQPQDVIGNTAVKTVQPSIPEQPPAPGASQPPENPVSGSSTPVTGDPESRLGIRKPGRINGMPADKAIGEAQANVDAIPGRDKPSTSAAAGSEDDFGARVRELTSAEGGDMFRGAAVKQANAERVAAGKAPLRYDDVINAMREQDRQASAQATKERILTSRFAELDSMLDPAAMLNKARGPAGPSPVPSRVPLVGGSSSAPIPTAPAPAPPAATPSLPFRLGQAARSFSETNLPDATVAAAEGFARRERSGYERIAAAGEAKVDEGIAKARRAIGLATLRVTDRNRRTADTLRRIREEFAAGRTGNPQR